MENPETPKSANAFGAFIQILLAIFKNPTNGLTNYYQGKEKQALTLDNVEVKEILLWYVSPLSYCYPSIFQH